MQQIAGILSPLSHIRHLAFLGEDALVTLFPKLVGETMAELEQGELRVVVPVGFLLQEEQEVAVSVNRPDGRPLPIRLRLVPAQTGAISVSEQTPAAINWPAKRAAVAEVEDGYPTPDFGGSD